MESKAKSSATNDLSNSTNRNIWSKYRPPATAINFSDIIDDQTIYDRTNGRIEATFNSTIADQQIINPDAVSVDDILGNSMLNEIRDLSHNRHRIGASINDFEQKQSFNKYSTAKYPPAYNESFRPAEEMQELLKKDEREWDHEYADIPSVSGLPSTASSGEFLPKVSNKLTNISDFSGYLCTSVSDPTELSIGRYFLNRCQELQDVLPTKTPPKSNHTPMSLIPPNATQQSTGSIYQSQSNQTETTRKNDNEHMYRTSVASLSAIASHLEGIDSPHALVHKLCPKRFEPVKHLEQTKSDHLRNTNVDTTMQSLVNETKRSNIHFTHHENANENAVNGLNLMMNSTKIDEGDKENQWRNNNTADTRSIIYSSFSSETIVSPIKDQSPPSREATANNLYANKRYRSPTPPPTASPLPSLTTKSIKHLQSSNEHKINSQNDTTNTAKHNQLTQQHQFKSPIAVPLHDVLNNLHLSSPARNVKQMEQNPLRSVSELKWNTENREIDEHRRHYAVDIRSPDHMKLSLPNYGLHGLRGLYQDVAVGGVAVPLDKRSNSQCSTHSEFTQNDGKFPLKANTSELVWECVKLRKSVSKSFVIKNTSEKKLILKIGVFGPGFQITSPMNTNSLLLHGNECRTINITFCPTIIGKAIGKVTFRPTKNWPEVIERSVHLWAYGGSTVLQLQGIERGPVGSSFLKMADTSTIVSTTLERTFTIYNKGPLNGVATVFLKPKTNQCINEHQITIEPSKCVIRPDRTATIRVTYKLRRRDIERLKDKTCEVLTIGTLEVIFGSEANRQRIASMLTRHGGTVPTTYKQLEFLVHDFPVASAECFTDYREHIENVPDLFGCFRTAEIALTINRTCLDETRNGDFTCIDDSVLFRTLVETPKEKAKP